MDRFAALKITGQFERHKTMQQSPQAPQRTAFRAGQRGERRLQGQNGLADGWLVLQIDVEQFVGDSYSRSTRVDEASAGIPVHHTGSMRTAPSSPSC